VKYHYTVQQHTLAKDSKQALTFIVEVDPERLVLLRGKRALANRRGTAVLARGAIKILALARQSPRQGEQTAELEL